MSKDVEVIIVGAECEGCKYFKVKDRNKVICEARDKTYYYGQCIQCDDKERIK